MRDHGRRLILLPPLEIDADLRPMAIAQRGLDQDMSTVATTGFGDRAKALAVAARVLARDEPEIARELGRTLEAAPVDDLRRQHHRRVQRDAAEALEAPHHGGECRQEHQLLDLAIQLVAPL